MSSSNRWLTPFLLIGGLILVLAFTASLPMAFYAFEGARVRLFLVLIAGLLIALVLVILHALRILTQYAQAFHDLTPSEAWRFVGYSILDLRRYPSMRPSLRVRNGQADPDGPVLIHRVGGPGYLSVDHDNVAVTQRLGKLHRIHGPGFAPLDPFERVWDVVDLRPQHRKIQVDFMTRDGIPAHCDAEMTFRIAGGNRSVLELDGEESAGYPYSYSENAVLKVATSKYVRSSNGSREVSDWTTGIAQGALDGEIRDELEKYTLDQLLNPFDALDEKWIPTPVMRYLRDHKPVPSDDRSEVLGVLDVDNPTENDRQFLHELEEQIKKRLRRTGAERGIDIESVELTELRPDQDAVFQQWLDYWQAKVQTRVNDYQMRSHLHRVQITEQVRADVKVNMIMGILKRFGDLAKPESASGEAIAELPPELIISGVLDVLESMCGQGPEVQRLVFQQTESLIRVINAIAQDDSPFGPPDGGVGDTDSKEEERS